MKCFGITVFLIIWLSAGISQIKTEELQGDWTCFNTGCEEVCETCCRNLVYFDLRIHNDSVDIFDYPHAYFGSYKIESFVDSINLKYLDHNSGNHPFFNNATVVNDTLTTNTNYSFYRDTFDQQLVTTLIKDSLNFKELMGKWEIVLEYPEDYGTGPFYVELPFKVTDQLNFTSEAQLPTTRFLRLRVNGELKLFYIQSLTNYQLTIITGSWYEKNIVNSARGAYHSNPPGKFIIDYRKVYD